MSEEEIRRAGVLKRVKSGELTQVEAADILSVSYRQLKRIYVRYRESGAKGLVHRSAGKPSNRARPSKERERILKIVRKEYGGGPGERLGPTLAAEHLEEDYGMVVDSETLRRWMLAEGLWTKERKRKPYRQRRARRAHFGELVQMDGSFEKWLEDRGPRGCLIHMVDDATSTSLGRFADEESTWAVADALRAWVTTYGIPCALYVDWKNVYHHVATAKQKERGIEPVSQFGRMCRKLGIELIGANSAQAKGRVERGHGTHQDRLIKKMRLKEIATYEEANRYLETTYLAQHNGKYAVEARDAADYHVAMAKRLDLNQVFCLEEERKVSQDWVVQYGTRWLQIERQGQKVMVRSGATVLVREHRDGSLTLWLNNTKLQWHELTERPKKANAPRKPKGTSKTKRTPPQNHPWREQSRAAARLREAIGRVPTPPVTAGRMQGKGPQAPAPSPAPLHR
jgi:transposase